MLPNVNVFIGFFIFNIFYVYIIYLTCIYVYICKYVLEGRMVDLRLRLNVLFSLNKVKIK